MGSYSELYINDYPVFSTKSYVNPTIMTIFRESDKNIFERKLSERNEITWGSLENEDEIEIGYEYTNTVSNIIQRLDVMGFSFKSAKKEFEEIIISEIEELSYNIDDDSLASLKNFYSSKIAILEDSSFDNWLEALKEIIEKKLTKRTLSEQSWDKLSPLIQYILSNNDWGLSFAVLCKDIRCSLRLLLEIVPKDAFVTQDITEIVNAGYYDENENVCEKSIIELTQDYPINEKIVILAEGSTDINVLEKSLKLLYPHLSEYYSFMDFGLSNAQGSAGNLVNTIKAFVGSGISNRIIAIFDNDSAGFDAIRGLNKTSVPSNIRIMNYPNVEIAKSYPTLGPSGLSDLDINGLACSIEVYFGEDVLKIDGELSPIQWKGYIDGVKNYQGEIMNKAKLQEVFNEKLKNCLFDQTNQTDQTGHHSDRDST